MVQFCCEVNLIAVNKLQLTEVKNKYQAVKLSPGGSFAPLHSPGAVYARRRICTVPYTRGTIYARCHIRMAPYMHGAVYAWSHIRMEPYMHGAVYLWCQLTPLVPSLLPLLPEYPWVPGTSLTPSWLQLPPACSQLAPNGQ